MSSIPDSVGYIYIPYSLNLRLLESLRGAMGTYVWLDTKIVLKKLDMSNSYDAAFVHPI